MKCPQCNGFELEPHEVEEGLVGAKCAQCSGALLSLLNYRYWCKATHVVEINNTHVHGVEDNHHALVCPKCSRLMIKYKIGPQHENRIDLCANCDEVWFDKNEWELLKDLGYHDDLPNIFTDAWQRDIRRQRQAQVQQERYEKLIGKEDFEKIKDFKTWLDANQHKESIKQYLLY